MNCLLWRAGLQSAPLHIIPWSILPPPCSLCGCTVESLLTLPHALPSRSSWSMLPTLFSLQLYCREPARAPSRTSLALPHALPSRSSWSSCSLHSSLTLPSVDGSSLVLSVVELWRACLCSASRSLRSSPRLMAPHWFSLWLYRESLLVLPLTLLYLPSTPRPAPSNTPG